MPIHGMRSIRNLLDAPFFLVVRALFVACIVAGCYGLAINAKQGSYSTQQKRTEQLYSEFGRGQPLVQSFQSDRAYLTTLVFYASRLKSAYAGASLSVRLRHPGAEKDLAMGQFSLGAVDEQEMLTFNFPPLEHSKDTTYELVIETNLPAGSVGVWTSAQEAYSEGTLLHADQPLPFDLAFFTYYRLPWLATLNANNLAHFFDMLILLIFYGWIGWNLLVLFNFTEHATLLDGLSALFSMSLAFFSVLFAVMSVVAIKITSQNLVWVCLALSVVSILSFLYRKPRFPTFSLPSHDWFFWSIATLLVYALFARSAQIDGLYVPNWIDGLVHQRSLDKIITTGAQSTSQIYHAGFYPHAILTSFLTSTSIPEAMLISGQFFSSLGGLTFLLLASRFIASRAALLLSAACYWFLAPFPAYLITWSRFPLLLGLVLLPALIVFSKELLRTAKWSLVLPMSLLFTGTLLAHYGVIVIFGSFLAAWLIIDSTARAQLTRLFKTAGWRLPLIIFGAILPALVFLAPKALHFLSDPASRQRLIDLSQEAASQIDALHLIKLSAQNGGILVWVLAALGLLATLAWSRKNVLLLLGWYAILGAATWLQIQLWGVAISSYANLIISISIPLSILAGLAAQILFSPTPWLTGLFAKIRLKAHFFVALGLALITFAGSYSQLGTVNPISVLFAERDLHAAQWIRTHTTPGDLILINSFRWGETYWPADGGGWLKPLTARQVIYASSVQEVSEIDALVASQKIRFVYLGQGYGELTVRHFLENPAYQLLYQEQGISIFTVKNSP
jgi:hypothetical protein